ADATGTLTATLNVTDNAVGSPQQIALTGNVIDPVAQFNPARLSFGTQAVNSSVTLPVQLTNSGLTPLNISNIGITGANSSGFSESNDCPKVLSSTMSCSISVTFAPTSKGARTGTLTVTDNVAGGQSTVALTGTGH
ncbi:MAG: choice-of-anchor D domain-containing protein, partial [Terriglobales bacterium]